MEAKHTATPNLPEPYVEVFIWWRGVRRVARLDASKKHFQLATFLADTKGQYLASVEEVERWSPIADGNAHDELVKALQAAKALLKQRGIGPSDAVMEQVSAALAKVQAMKPADQ